VDTREKQKMTPMAGAEANNCAISPSGGYGHSWIPQTSGPKLISQTTPNPSSNDQKLRANGKVHIRAMINVDGSVAPLSVIHGINPVIDQEALETVRNWKFEPARLVGLPVATRMEVEVKFQSR
jgi:TonB family protein